VQALPARVRDGEAKAAFSKKQGLLTVTMPIEAAELAGELV